MQLKKCLNGDLKGKINVTHLKIGNTFLNKVFALKL